MSYKFLLSLFALFLLFPVCSVQAQENLSQKLSGRILLQVEQNGEAWYINPEDKKKHSLGRPADAFQVMREQGVGISGQDLSKIQPAVDNLTGDDSDGDGLPDAFEEAVGTDPETSDTDGDGYSDQEELQNGYNPQGTGKLNTDIDFVQKHQGKILLQVEDQGQAWYVNPENNKRYFLGRPGDAFKIMRELGLGISDEDFNKLSEADSGQDQNNSQAIGDCQSFPEKLEVCEPFTCEFDHPLTGEKMQREIKGLEDGKCVYIEEMPNDGKMECNYTEDYYQAVAQYYRDTYKADSFGTEVENRETTHTIDGKEVENPLQEAMDQGQCVVSEGQKEEQGEEETLSQLQEQDQQDTSLNDQAESVVSEGELLIKQYEDILDDDKKDELGSSLGDMEDLSKQDDIDPEEFQEVMKEVQEDVKTILDAIQEQSQ